MNSFFVAPLLSCFSCCLGVLFLALGQSLHAETSADAAGAPSLVDEVSSTDSVTATSVENSLQEKAAQENALQEKDPLEEEMQRLQSENRLAAERLRQSLAGTTAEIERLETAHRLHQAQLKEALLATSEEVERLKSEMALDEVRAQKANQELKVANERLQLELAQAQIMEKQQLASLEAQKNYLAAQRALEQEQFKARLAELELERSELAFENLRLAEESKTKELELKARQMEIQAKSQELDLRNKELMTEKLSMESELSALNLIIETRRKEEELNQQVAVQPPYPEQPFVDGALAISDRRISLNEPIITGTADYVTERIHFFNNQSTTAPVFIVIDRCPGGSVMEGYRILKAMEASKAPVHVVVKSFAASMAAVIATLADHSYAYPNALLLHHQPSGGSYGNVTQQGEQYEVMQEWARRLHAPVAEKMGVTMEQFYEQMYENNSDGDWAEFGDVAQSLKWVDHVVYEIREEGILKRPNSVAPKPFYFFFGEEEAPNRTAASRPNGVPVGQKLPPMQPFDFYFIHNPIGYYSW